MHASVHTLTPPASLPPRPRPHHPFLLHSPPLSLPHTWRASPLPPPQTHCCSMVRLFCRRTGRVRSRDMCTRESRGQGGARRWRARWPGPRRTFSCELRACGLPASLSSYLRAEATPRLSLLTRTRARTHNSTRHNYTQLYTTTRRANRRGPPSRPNNGPNSVSRFAWARHRRHRSHDSATDSPRCPAQARHPPGRKARRGGGRDQLGRVQTPP
jgi:hypothetical protein